MGFGGVTAMGCSIGQGLTGLSMLSAGAVLAVAGIVARRLGRAARAGVRRARRRGRCRLGDRLRRLRRSVSSTIGAASPRRIERGSSAAARTCAAGAGIRHARRLRAGRAAAAAPRRCRAPATRAPPPVGRQRQAALAACQHVAHDPALGIRGGPRYRRWSRYRARLRAPASPGRCRAVAAGFAAPRTGPA